MAGSGEYGPVPLHASSVESYRRWFVEGLSARRHALGQALDDLSEDTVQLARAAAWLIESLQGGNKVLVIGNGGSAAAAQHLAAELVGRFRCDRAPLPALALTTDTAVLTALANDFGYPQVFSRQVQALSSTGDVLVIFSTSGCSANIVEAARVARDCGIRVIAFVGSRLSPLHAIADLVLAMPTAETPLVQELHTIMAHLLCELVERELVLGQGYSDATSGLP